MDIEKLIEQLNGYFEGKDLKRCVALDSATALSTLQAENQALRNAANGFKAENEKLRAEQERVKRERDAAVKQEFIPGGNVWIVERDEDGEATEVSGYVFVASVSGVAIVSPSINGCRDLDFILGDFVKETARSFSGDFSGYPISDCHESYEEADAALRREQDG